MNNQTEFFMERYGLDETAAQDVQRFANTWLATFRRTGDAAAAHDAAWRQALAEGGERELNAV